MRHTNNDLARSAALAPEQWHIPGAVSTLPDEYSFADERAMEARWARSRRNHNALRGAANVFLMFAAAFAFCAVIYLNYVAYFGAKISEKAFAFWIIVLVVAGIWLAFEGYKPDGEEW